MQKSSYSRSTVIVVSLIVQGLTLEPLARRAGIARPDAARHEETVARLRLAEAALARLDELDAGECAADDVIDRARARLPARLGYTRARIDGTRAPNIADQASRPTWFDPRPSWHTCQERIQEGVLAEQHEQRGSRGRQGVRAQACNRTRHYRSRA